jgi:hypothetical protein
MCFSLPASLITGSVLLAAGAISLARCRRRAEIPLAMIPLCFGIQQLVEGGVWATLGSTGAAKQVLVHAYLFFSNVFWPVFMPWTVLMLEAQEQRRRAMRPFVWAGSGLAAFFLYVIFGHPVDCVVYNHNLSYEFANPFPVLTAFLYMAVTGIGALRSSQPLVRVFGGLLLLLAAVAQVISIYTFVSVWCFFAAVLSLVILLYFNMRRAGAATPALSTPAAQPGPGPDREPCVPASRSSAVGRLQSPHGPALLAPARPAHSAGRPAPRLDLDRAVLRPDLRCLHCGTGRTAVPRCLVAWPR